MKRSCSALLLALFTMFCVAQDDAGLTEEFSKLSAKERARIAKQEQEEAAKDPKYQAVMAKAEDLFKQRQYDDALARFTEARGIRPYNVYPKVKIQDLQALIAKREAERAALPDTSVVRIDPPKPVITPVAQQVEAVVVVQSAPPPSPEPIPVPKVEPPPVVRPVVEKPKAIAPPRDTVRVAPLPVESAPKLADGTTERTYQEGRAIVLERQVVTNGKVVIYKKVTHPWGEPVYFKDGIAIPARVWNEAFGAR